MFCLFNYRCCLTDSTIIIFHFGWRVKQFLASIALVTSCILKFTKRTDPTNKSVSKEKMAFFAITLSHSFFFDPVILLDIKENLLTDLGVPLG